MGAVEAIRRKYWKLKNGNLFELVIYRTDQAKENYSRLGHTKQKVSRWLNLQMGWQTATPMRQLSRKW